MRHFEAASGTPTYTKRKQYATPAPASLFLLYPNYFRSFENITGQFGKHLFFITMWF
jgi:hypothetical protein